MTAVKSERAATQIDLQIGHRLDSKIDTEADSPVVDSREVVAILRTSVLELLPEDVGLDSDALPSSVWGVMIETAHPDAVATLVALHDGSVSLYVSDGSGCVGCGGHRDVREASVDLLQHAARCLELSTPTDDKDYGPEGSIRFYFLGRDGLRSAEVRLEALNSSGAELGALYFAGQRLLNVIESLGAGQSIGQEIRFAQLAGASALAKGSPPCLSVGNAVRRLQR